MQTTKSAPVFALVLAGLYALSHVLAARPYVDDLGRSVTGYLQWSGAGRPMADVVMWLLNLGTPLSDLSPLPQLFGIGLVALGCWLIATRVLAGVLPPLVAVGCAFLVLLNPFVLQNMAYKFDAFPMGLAMLAAVVPVLLPWQRFAASLALGVVLVLVALSTYQTSVNLTIGLAIFAVIPAALMGEPAGLVLKRLAGIAGGVLIAMLIYAVVIPAVFSRTGYVAAHSALVPLNLAGLAAAIDNLRDGLSFIQAQFAPSQLAAIAAFSVVAQLAAIVVAVLVVRAKGQVLARLALALLVVLAPVLTLFASVGNLVVISQPILASRVFMGFGAFLLCIVTLSAVAVVSVLSRMLAERRKAWAGIAAMLVVAIPLLACLNVAYAFSNAEKAQAELDAQLVERVRVALHDIGVEPPVNLVILGTAPTANRAAFHGRRYPLINRLVRSYLEEGSYFGPAVFRYYGFGAKILSDEVRDRAKTEATGRPPDFEDAVFTLTKFTDGVVLTFPEAP